MARGRRRPPPRLAGGAGHALGDRLVGLVDRRDAERRRRPVAGVDQRRDEDRQLAATRCLGDRGAGVDHRHRGGVAGAALPAARAQLVELRGDPGSPVQRSTSGWRGESSTKRASPTASRCGVKTVERRPRGRSGRARPRRCARGCSAGFSARARPSSRSARGCASFSSRKGDDAQEPGRAADQPHLVVAAPAAAVLDLERGQGRLAGVAPVDGRVVAVDQPRLEQGRKSHWDQRYWLSSEL